MYKGVGYLPQNKPHCAGKMGNMNILQKNRTSWFIFVARQV